MKQRSERSRLENEDVRISRRVVRAFVKSLKAVLGEIDVLYES